MRPFNQRIEAKVLSKAKAKAYRAERGQATLEAVFALPCIIFLILVFLEGACMFNMQMAAYNAARTGFSAIEASSEVTASTITDLRANPDGKNAADIEKIASEAIVRDLGWSSDAITVNVECVDGETENSYRHQIPNDDGSWLTDETGTQGRSSYVYNQSIKVEIVYQAPAMTPVGYLAAAFFGDGPFTTNYPVYGQVVGVLDTTTQERW